MNYADPLFTIDPFDDKLARASRNDINAIATFSSIDGGIGSRAARLHREIDLP
jgi:hypothetical protein